MCVCGTLTGGEDALDELLTGHLPVLILVDAAEEIHDSGLFVVHPAHVALPPHVKVEVGKFFELHKKAQTHSQNKVERQSNRNSMELQ